MILVDAIKTKVLRGFPNGVEDARKDIPLLLERIRELENGLWSFARIATIADPNASGDVVQCYRKDVIKAWQLLDANQGDVPPAPQIEFPAE